MNTLFLLFIVNCFAAQYTYDCGDTTETGNTVKCYFDDSTYEFIINGTGKMKDYNASPKPDWSIQTITKVVISEGVTSIGAYSFNGMMGSVANVEIASSVTIIKKSAFYNCRLLKNVTIKENSKLTTIEETAFYECGLTSITLPSSVTSIGENAFFLSFSNSMKEFNILGEGSVYSSKDGVLFKKNNGIKELILYPNGKEDENYTIPNDVTVIAKEGIFGNCYLKKLNCGNVKTIKEKALSGLRIESINLDNVETLETNAFYSCRDLQTITLGKNLNNLNDNVFFECNSIAQLKVNEENKHYKDIDGILFSKDGSILIKCPKNKQFTENKYVVPDSVVTIFENAFDTQQNLKELEIGGKVENIRLSAFKSIVTLQKVKLSGNIKSISEAVFSHCTGLKEVIIGDNVKMIGSSMFLSCGSLSNVTIGENSQIITIEQFAFQGTAITSFTIPKATKYIRNEAFKGCSSLESVVIGENVTHIASSAFESCSKLKTVTFKGSNVLRINHNAFSGSVIESIEIPSSVKYIDDGAFSSKLMKTITFKGENQPAYCSRSAFDTTANLSLNVDSTYNQEEFCGIPTGKGIYEDIPNECKQ